MQSCKEPLRRECLHPMYVRHSKYITLGPQVNIRLQKVFEEKYLKELHRFSLQSSPGGMSDVGSTLTPPGLPLREPPRIAGSYGVSLNDPVFGISSGSIPCENLGHRPQPAQAPIPPPPPQQGVGDPVAQGAMSDLLIQMAQDFGTRSWWSITIEWTRWCIRK